MKISDILKSLKEPVDPSLISSKRVGNSTIAYIAWFDICELLDNRVGLGNWFWQITNTTTTNDRLFLTGRLTIIGDDRTISQDSTGTEILNCSSYGDPSSNAEAMALRRCAAKFGLARYLWDKEKDNQQSPLVTKKGKGEITREQWVQLKANQG